MPNCSRGRRRRPGPSPVVARGVGITSGRDGAPGLVPSLSDRIDSVLGSLLPPGSRCALVNYPNHWNTGDPAIWLGALEALRRIGVTVAYQCEWRTYHPAALRTSIGDGPILITGGGNLGDLWLNPQRFRERILKDFPDNPVIQLPQSIWFEQQENIESFGRLCASHGNFLLLLREEQSLAFARSRFDVESVLCPDMAFALGPLQRAAPPQTNIFWLARSDAEARSQVAPSCGPDMECRDWIMPGPEELALWAGARVFRHNDRLTQLALGDAEAARRLWPRLADTFEPMARARLARGASLLSHGRVVITDRLHGHILCLCLGIPHVLLDNSYGKVQSTYRTWTSQSSLVRWARSGEEAVELARSLAESPDLRVAGGST